MTPSESPSVLARIASKVLGFILHTLIASVLASVISICIIAIAANVLPNKGIFIECLVFAVALGIGFLVNRVTLTRLACWVWLPGLVWLVFAIRDSVRDFDPRWYQGCSATQNVVNAFFVLDSHRCGGGGSTLAGVFFTLPAFCSLAYSVGAWIALRTGLQVSNSSFHTT